MAVQGQKYIVNGLETMYLCSHNGKQTFVPLAGGAPIPVENEAQIRVVPVGAPAAAPAQQFMPPPVQAPPPAAVAAPPPPAAAAAPPPPPMQAPPAPAVAPPPPVQAAAPIAAAPPPPVQAPPVGEAPKRGRGRPSKAEKAAAAGQTVAAAQASQGITLYLNAVPNGPFVDLTGYVYEATTLLEEQFDVPDIRSATGEGPLAFARWRGALAAMVKAEPPPPGIYVAFTKGDEFTEVVAAAVASLCAPGQFIRGV
jgi:hypothetical protein